MYSGYQLSSPQIVRPNPYTKISAADLEKLFPKENETDDNGCQAIMIIGAIVLIIIIFSMSFNACKKRYDRMNFVSGRKSSTKGTDCHAKTDFTNFKVENLTHCSESDSKCKNFKQVENTVKIENGEKIKDFDNNNDEVLYMVYAPWCPHCHTALPKFCDASTKSDTKFALINAELVPNTLLQGKESLLQVTHFPFICHKSQDKKEVFKAAPTSENIVAFAAKKVEDTPPPAPKNPLDLMFN